jgi:pimeloyl-ACP methyl ester carboxylesterase
MMNAPLMVLAALLSAIALYLPMRSQQFTRVTVDGRSMRMLVTGGGNATVVLESGLGGILEHWGKVQPAVSRFAKTVSYDRAGLGLSDDGPRPRDGRRIATELREALRAAAIAPPYILVGASMGGRYIRVFTGMYPEDVAGLVLVDPTPDNEAFEDEMDLPETESQSAALDQARGSSIPGGVPVVLIDAISPLEVPFANAGIRALRMRNRSELEAETREHRRWMDTIPGSRLITTHRSGHNVFLEQPRLVIDTIREVVEEISRPVRR